MAALSCRGLLLTNASRNLLHTSHGVCSAVPRWTFQGARSTSTVQKRYISNTSAKYSAEKPVEDVSGADAVVLYKAPLSRAIRTLKTVSVTSCTLTVVFVPLVSQY